MNAAPHTSQPTARAEISRMIDAAKALSPSDAAARLGISGLKPHGVEMAGPCPVCGGRDRFSISPKKAKWLCRRCDRGGGDGLSLAGFVMAHDLKSYDGLARAAADALGESLPADFETQDDRQARQRRIAETRARSEAETRRREQAAIDWRVEEIGRCAAIWKGAGSVAGTAAAEYLAARIGLPLVSPALLHLRFAADLNCWHTFPGEARGRVAFTAPAMVGSFRDGAGRFTGVHLTWIDLGQPPKFRPAVDDGAGGTLPTKKMRGTKKGSIVPVAGRMGAARWAVAEGIENIVAIAVREGFDPGTFYCAAGDIENICGPGAATGRFAHPQQDAAAAAGKGKGGGRRAMVPSPEPAPGPAMPVGETCLRLDIFADGDSEKIWTAALMARAVRRYQTAARQVRVHWPRAGMDWAEMMAEAANERIS